MYFVTNNANTTTTTQKHTRGIQHTSV